MALTFQLEEFRKAMITKRQIENRFSMQDVSNATGISKSTISRIERGRWPDIVTFCICCDWLGLPPGYFFTINKKNTNQ